jgi:hypothetical protein
MAPEEEAAKSELSPSEASGPRSSPGRGRRSGRGRRGHGRRPRPKRSSEEPPAVPPSGSAAPADETETIFELADERGADLESRPSNFEATAPASEPSGAPDPSSVLPDVTPASSGSQTSVYKAIEEVNAIVDSLRGALDDMEEILEMLELFERQKNADEREIESLRRALRQVHRTRDGGHPR